MLVSMNFQAQNSSSYLIATSGADKLADEEDITCPLCSKKGIAPDLFSPNNKVLSLPPLFPELNSFPQPSLLNLNSINSSAAP